MDTHRIYALTREMFSHEVTDSIWAVGSGRGMVATAAKNSLEVKGKQKEETFFRVGDPVELSKVVSGSATQTL